MQFMENMMIKHMMGLMGHPPNISDKATEKSTYSTVLSIKPEVTCIIGICLWVTGRYIYSWFIGDISINNYGL